MQQEPGPAAAFRTEMLRRAAVHGRTVKVLPGLIPILGSTQAEAEAKKQQLLNMQAVDYALEHVSMMLQVDLTDCLVDGPFPLDRLPPLDQIKGNRTTYELIRSVAGRDGATLRDVLAHQGFGRGHLVTTGTPESVADVIGHWVTTGAADGFNVMPAVLPTDLTDFVEQVVPLLQGRGLFRKEYEAGTLRDRYR